MGEKIVYIVNRDNCPGPQVMGRPPCDCRYHCKSLFPLGKSQRVWCWFCPRRKLDCSVSMKCRFAFYCEEYSVSIQRFYMWYRNPIVLMVIPYWWMTRLLMHCFTKDSLPELQMFLHHCCMSYCIDFHWSMIIIIWYSFFILHNMECFLQIVGFLY